MYMSALACAGTCVLSDSSYYSNFVQSLFLFMLFSLCDHCFVHVIFFVWVLNDDLMYYDNVSSP